MGAAQEDVGPGFRGDFSGSAGPAWRLWEGLWEASLGEAAGVPAERGPAGLAWGGWEEGGATRGGAGTVREARRPCGPCRSSSHPLPVMGQAIWDPDIKAALQIPSGSPCSWGLENIQASR